MKLLNHRKRLLSRAFVDASLVGLCFLIVVCTSCGSEVNSSSSVGGGCPDTTALNDCPGAPVVLDVGTPVSHSATMPCFSGKLIPYCSHADDGAEIIYDVVPAAKGTVHVTLASPSVGTLFAYGAEQCGRPTKMVACKEAGESDPAGRTTDIYLAVEMGHHYGIVYQEPTSSGYYASDVVLTFALKDSAECGNGLQEEGEECDFGKVDAEADGCNQCQIIAQSDGASADTCPSDARIINLGQTITLSGYTTGSVDDYQACGAIPGGPDRTFRVTPKATGMLSVAMTSDFDAVLAAFGDCSAGVLDSLFRCSDDMTSGGSESVSFPVVMDKDYYILVDGYSSKAFGALTLNVSLQ